MRRVTLEFNRVLAFDKQHLTIARGVYLSVIHKAKSSPYLFVNVSSGAAVGGQPVRAEGDDTDAHVATQGAKPHGVPDVAAGDERLREDQSEVGQVAARGAKR